MSANLISEMRFTDRFVRPLIPIFVEVSFPFLDYWTKKPPSTLVALNNLCKEPSGKTVTELGSRFGARTSNGSN